MISGSTSCSLSRTIPALDRNTSFVCVTDWRSQLASTSHPEEIQTLNLGVARGTQSPSPLPLIPGPQGQLRTQALAIILIPAETRPQMESVVPCILVLCVSALQLLAVDSAFDCGGRYPGWCDGEVP